MYYYLILFALTAMLTARAENRYRRNKNKSGHFYSILVVLIFGLFAGMRSTSVGIDVNVYVTPYLEVAKQSSNFFDYMNRVAVEPAYGLLTYINGRFFSTPFLTLFVSQILAIGPIYFLIYKKRENLSMPLCIIIYDLMFFNVTLCIMRQFIAAAFIMLAVMCYKDNKKIFALLSLIAISFHISSAICIPIYIVLMLLQRAKFKRVYNVIIILALFAVLAFLEPILAYATTIGIIPPQYYAVFIAQSNMNQLSIVEKSLQAVTIFIPVIVSKIRNNKMLYQASYYALFGFFLSFAAIKSQYLLRLSFSFEIFTILALSLSREGFDLGNKNKSNVLIYKSFIIGIMFVYWWLVFIAWNYYGTAHFIFR